MILCNHLKQIDCIRRQLNKNSHVIKWVELLDSKGQSSIFYYFSDQYIHCA